MKTYIISEEDTEELLKILDCGGDSDWWYISRVQDWLDNQPCLITNSRQFKITGIDENL